MRATFLTVLLLFSAGVAPANTPETGTLSGKVTLHGSQTGVSASRVLIEGTAYYALTDEQGNYVIAGVPPGVYTVVVRHIGFEESRSPMVGIEPGKTTLLLVQLKEAVIPLKEIQITAGKAKRAEDVRASLFSLTPTQTRKLPGVVEDVMRSLQAVPGVLAMNDFTSQLVIRGSGPDQNLIIMDDIEVFNPYRLYGLISMFNPETVSDINLITGGFPARYGDRLSAVLDVSNRDGEMHSPLKGSVNVSITNANIVLSGGMPFGVDGSYIISGRRTYYDLILGPIARRSGLVSGDVAFPNFADVQGKFALEPAPGHRIIANALLSRDGVDLLTGADRDFPDSVNVLDRTTNNVAGLAWHYFPSRDFYSKLNLSWYKNRGDTEFGGDFIDPALDRVQFENGGDTTGIRFFNVEFNSSYMFSKVAVKEEVGWSLPSHLIEAAAGVDFLTTSLIWHLRPDETFRSILTERGIAFVNDFVQSRHYVRSGLYVQDKIRLNDALSIQPGVRLDYYEILDRAFLQPRLNASLALDPITILRGAWGIYRQSPGYEKLLDQQVFYDLSRSGTGGLTAEQATHYVVGVERWLDNAWQVKVEAYYKKFDNVIVQAILPGTLYETSPIPGSPTWRQPGWTEPVGVPGDSLTTDPVNGASGRSYGIEILLEKRNIGPDSRFSGWIGYALARAERMRGDLVQPFRFDQRHTVDVVLDYRAAGWLEIGLRWKYGSNFPYTPAVGLKPRMSTVRENGMNKKVIQVDREGNVIFDVDRDGDANRLSARLPAYHRLDLRVTATTAFWGMDWSFYLDVINVYNHLNVLTYQFYQGKNSTLEKRPIGMLPIVPTLGISARF